MWSGYLARWISDREEDIIHDRLTASTAASPRPVNDRMKMALLFTLADS